MMFSAPMNDTDSSSVLPDQTCQRLTLAEIQLVTRNFDETFVIGRGGFGNVYKCSTKIGSTKQVAVKRLNSMSNQGAHEFEAEVQILSKLRHGNLVSLTGYCNEGNEMALVYEFMPNGTLEDNLRKPDSCLSWLQRLTICIGAARGLDYLHTGTSTQHGVIHRDVKSSNILLDANFDAKISDFGLAKVGLIDRTHMSTAVKGTFGYMDPCYFYTGNLTIKSDVYAFGVILFEILSGRKAVDSTLDEEQWSLAAWAQHQIKVGKLNQIIDPKLIGQISKKCLKDFARIAGQCLHTLPKQRPTMAEVFVKLEFILSQERESSNSVVDEERFIYKLRSFFSGKADADIGSKYDLSDIDDEIESESDCSIHRELILIEDGGAIESNKEQSLRTFTYTELASATNGFEKEVYSPTSTESIYIGWVAERTYAPTKHGVGLAIYVRRMEILEWQKVIKLEKFNHPNIVKLLGYCLSNRALYCVYELIPGTSLDECLYGEPSTKPLSWVARLNIAIGAAEGHFHSQKRNQPAYNQFKTSFILVDMDFNARLSDFSFGPNTYMIDRYYEAPVWFGYRKDDFTMKDAIYTFGVILLEILTGLKVYDERRSLPKQNLVEWATPLLEDEMNMGMIMDPKLQDYHCSPKGVFRLAVLV